ncbi:MAG: hypothetical protein IPM42_14505 [Saprospiraceae bacterium]|nr:hypothetical protein [Saprospiraceae bacterium]
MKRLISTFVLSLSVSLSLYCQLDSILSITDQNKRHAAFLDYLEDNYQTFKVYDSILTDAEKRIENLPDEKLKQEIWFYKQDHKSRTYNGPTLLSAMTPMIKAVEEARRKTWNYIQAKLCASIGHFYHAQGQTQDGFEYLVKALDLVNQLDIKEYPEIVRITDVVAHNYYIFGDELTALNLYKKGNYSDSYWRNKKDLYQIYNTIGLCHQKQMQVDSAIYYYELAHKSALQMGDEFWAALTEGNRAYCQYLAGNYDEALPPLLKDFELSVLWGEIGSAVNAAMTIAAIYLEKNDIGEATKYLEYGRKHQNRLDTRQKINYYKSLNQISRQTGNYKQALIYLDSMQIYKDSAAISNDAGIIRNAELKLNLEKHKYEIELLESEKSKQITLRNAVLIIICLLGIIVGLWFFNMHLKKKRALELAEQEKISAFQELERAEKELKTFTAVIREKNELIQSVRAEMAELEQLNHGEERIQYINELLNSNILTEDDWREFKLLFDKVYPGFFVKLHEKIPQLTQAEVRLLALLKLNMNQKDMAFMLGVGYDAIRKVKQRLKFKITDREEASLEEIVENI